jgi:hypothetical protein
MTKEHKPPSPEQSATLKEAIQFLTSENVKAYKIIERLNHKCEYLMKIINENKSAMLKNTGIIITMLINSFMPHMLYAQEPMLKKANTIVISDSLSQQQYFSKISDILFESGYGILNSDKETGTITTTEKPIKNSHVRLTLLIKDQKVLLRGQININLSINIDGVTAKSSFQTIENAGSKKSPLMEAWNEMVKIASQIPGEKEYQIK